MNQENAANTVAWPMVLAAAAVGGTLATACMMPFVAIATLAAATMTRRQAVTAVLGVWAANQLVGFGLLGYPMTLYAAAWGIALGAGGVVALAIARRVLPKSARSAARLVVAFVAAFAAYETFLFGFALVVGGTATFAPAIVLRILANDTAWFVALVALHAVLTRAAPRVFGTAPALRFV